ncbi:MAG: M15 family metallopeptidase [Pikeienuella sp.]
MTGFKFSRRSVSRLKGVHPDIVSVLNRAIGRTPIDFTVLEGVRTMDRQKELVKKGASKTLNSRHLTGHAVDIAPLLNGVVSWDWPLYHELAPVVKQAAEDLGVDLEWGGDWTTFKDGPHWQLSWNSYGGSDMTPRARLTPEQPARATPNEMIAALAAQIIELTK